MLLVYDQMHSEEMHDFNLPVDNNIIIILIINISVLIITLIVNYYIIIMERPVQILKFPSLKLLHHPSCCNATRYLHVDTDRNSLYFNKKKH